MRALRLGGFAAIVLLCTALGASAETRKPGTTEPAATTQTTTTPPAGTGQQTTTEAKPATKKQVRHHRRWRHRYWHHGYYRWPFFDFFRPWPHYRYHRWHDRHHRWWHHGRYRRHWWWW